MTKIYSRLPEIPKSNWLTLFNKKKLHYTASLGFYNVGDLCKHYLQFSTKFINWKHFTLNWCKETEIEYVCIYACHLYRQSPAIILSSSKEIHFVLLSFVYIMQKFKSICNANLKMLEESILQFSTHCGLCRSVRIRRSSNRHWFSRFANGIID